MVSTRSGVRAACKWENRKPDGPGLLCGFPRRMVALTALGEKGSSTSGIRERPGGGRFSLAVASRRAAAMSSGHSAGCLLRRRATVSAFLGGDGGERRREAALLSPPR